MVIKDFTYSLGFQNILQTDNGLEFSNPMSIENDEVVSHVFYCDSEASWQKGAIEKNKYR